MKKLVGTLIAVMMAGSLTWGISMVPATSYAGEPMVVNSTPVVKMDKKKTFVDFYGTGFSPGTEIRVLFTDADGVQSDVGYALKPEPKVDENGNWVTRWNASRYVSKKLIKAGAATIAVTDSEYNTIATVPVSFYAEKKEKKK